MELPKESSESSEPSECTQCLTDRSVGTGTSEWRAELLVEWLSEWLVE